MKRSNTRALAMPSRIPAHVRLAAFLVLALAACEHARAATFCIAATDFAGLQSSLMTAANNGEDDFIELQRGQYSMPSNFLLDYEAVTEHHDLTIEGGYEDIPGGGPCGWAHTSPDPRPTVLDGGLLRLHLAAGVGSLTLKSITVQSTFGIDPNHPPIEMAAAATSTGNITIENMMFIGNGSTSTSAVYIFTAAGALSVRNSLFETNVSFAGQSPVRLGSLQTNASLCAAIVNSTFTGNTSSTAAVDVYTPMCLAVVANDIFWGNSGGDVVFDYPQSAYLLNDDLGDLSEAANTQASDLLSVDPLFKPDFSLRDSSPLRDKGNNDGFVFSPGPLDVIGNPRVYGSNPDIGAYEIQDVIFASDFDVEWPSVP